MEPQAECMLVLIGATPEGKKKLVGFQVGVRESAQSWRELLVDLKARGLAIAPELATGDGALGFWTALEAVFPATRHQRCWVHKAANVLDKLPKSVQPAAKQDLREIWQAPDRATAETAIVLSICRAVSLASGARSATPVPEQSSAPSALSERTKSRSVRSDSANESRSSAVSRPIPARRASIVLGRRLGQVGKAPRSSSRRCASANSSSGSAASPRLLRSSLPL